MKNAKNRIARTVVASIVVGLSMLWLPQSNIAQTKEAFAAFWTRFKAALAKDDRQAIAAMTKHCKCGQMPFESDKAFLDEWYGKIRRTRACLARSKPFAQNRQSYSVICRTDGDELLFERVGGEWKFINVNLAP